MSIKILSAFFLISSLTSTSVNTFNSTDLFFLSANATSKSDTGIEELWQELQKAETLLVQTSRNMHRERAGKIFQNVNLERPLLVLLLRVTFGLNNDGFSADDYHIRYPFSSKRLILNQLDALARSGYVSRDNTSSRFRIPERGRDLVSNYMRETGEMIQALNETDLNENEINAIIELDRRILSALILNKGEHGSPILNNRLGGLQPDYTRKQLWHHWQIIWSILAAQEDEQEYFRKNKKINPFVWYIRRNLWFTSRRPWLSGPQTKEAFINHFNGYAPVENGEEKIDKAIEVMKMVGWLEIKGDRLLLTEEGLTEHDEDEAQLMENFFSRWPELSQDSIERMYTLVSNLNNNLQDLNEKGQI